MQTQLQRPSQVKYDKSRKMMACQFNGKQSMKMAQVPVPMITDPTDAIVKVTATTISGSDLHVYHDMMPDMVKGAITGRESVGIIDEVGPQVKKVKKGDRVVICPVIACGQCDNCKRREMSCCETTNPSDDQEKMHGSHTSAKLGSSRTFGGMDGCQAEFVRVPIADVNLLPIPKNITDKQAVLLDDMASALHANELADVKQGDRVAVIGSGPVGILTQMWAKQRGASMIIAIDVDQRRLDMAKQKIGSMIINPKETDVLEAMKKLIPGGPDKVIDCVGFRFPDEGYHKAEMMLKMENDCPNVINMAVKMVRKNGRITLVGDYVGHTNHLNIGGLMEKHLTLNGGPVSPHNYSDMIFEAMASGKMDPTIVITHTYPLSKCDEVYKKLDKHEDGMMKVLLLPDELFNRTESDMK